MRKLLVHYLRLDVHFRRDEIHTLISAQTPLLGQVLRRIVRAMSGLLLKVIFSPPAEDPLPVLLSACGRDLAAIEASLNCAPAEKVASSAALLASRNKAATPAAHLLFVESSNGASTATTPK